MWTCIYLHPNKPKAPLSLAHSAQLYLLFCFLSLISCFGWLLFIYFKLLAVVWYMKTKESNLYLIGSLPSHSKVNTKWLGFVTGKLKESLIGYNVQLSPSFLMLLQPLLFLTFPEWNDFCFLETDCLGLWLEKLTLVFQ